MLSEIGKNKELAKMYSKYELVRVVFGILEVRKKIADKAHKKVDITEMVDQIITDLAENKITLEDIKATLHEGQVDIA